MHDTLTNYIKNETNCEISFGSKEVTVETIIIIAMPFIYIIIRHAD